MFIDFFLLWCGVAVYGRLKNLRKKNHGNAMKAADGERLEMRKRPVQRRPPEDRLHSYCMYTDSYVTKLCCVLILKDLLRVYRERDKKKSVF